MRRLLGKNFLVVERTQHAAFAKRAGGVNRRGGVEAAAKQDVMEDLLKKIRIKGRMAAENRWWVSELLAADCERAWIHAGWEDTMHKWYEWLVYSKKKSEKEVMEEMHQRKLEKMTGVQQEVLDSSTKCQRLRCGGGECSF